MVLVHIFQHIAVLGGLCLQFSCFLLDFGHSPQVVLHHLVYVDLFLKSVSFAILDNSFRLTIKSHSIQRKKEDIRRITNPLLIRTARCLSIPNLTASIVFDFRLLRIFPILHQPVLIHSEHNRTQLLLISFDNIVVDFGDGDAFSIEVFRHCIGKLFSRLDRRVV